ncbi:MAG: hypothetical protein IPJ59_19755 [Nannocystis sp.]|nr:hypothetical protein [Nannocystis sp.]
MCGDGVVQAGEVCDDGNQDDSDACLVTCSPAKCGDGEVQAGVEACDDGNADDLDACSDACVQASCFDKIANGGETDLDCGGACKQGCKFGQGCAVDSDCQAKSCEGGTCASGLTLPDCPGDPDVTAAIVFAAVVAPRCGPCHVAGQSAGGLNMLDAATMQANLVGVKAQTAAMLRVTPGDLDHSYLVYKLLDLAYYVTGGSGEGMPLDGPLSDAELCVVLDWISSGAK